MTSYQNGGSSHVPGPGNPTPSKRGQVDGWSEGVARRLRLFIFSIAVPELEGFGYAITLTMKGTPENAEAMHRVRRNFIRRLERQGMLRCLWVVEWQRRKVPHFHLAVFFPSELDEDARVRFLAEWCHEVAPEYEPRLMSQTFTPITDTLGWAMYLGKHAARGAKHYQRQGKPPGWGKTGRLWGYTGTWPTKEPARYSVSTEGFYRFRRLVRAWRVAQQRASDAPHKGARIRSARTMLKRTDRRLSAVAGVSEWISEDLFLQLIGFLVDEGYPVLQLFQDRPELGQLTDKQSGAREACDSGAVGLMTEGEMSSVGGAVKN